MVAQVYWERITIWYTTIKLDKIQVNNNLKRVIVNLSSTVPRNEHELQKIPLKKGLYLYFFFAYFMFFGAGMGLLGGIWNIIYTEDLKLGIFQAFFGTGFFIFLGLVPFYLPARKKLQLRKIAFQNGELTEAVVTKHYRKFVAWKSGRDWMIDATVILENGKKITGTLQTSNSQLARNLRPGTKLQALCVKNESIVFLPLEIGMQISISKNNTI